MFGHLVLCVIKPKDKIRKQKPLDTQAMNSTADSILRPPISPPSALPSGKKTKASGSTSAASATPCVSMQIDFFWTREIVDALAIGDPDECIVSCIFL